MSAGEVVLLVAIAVVLLVTLALAAVLLDRLVAAEAERRAGLALVPAFGRPATVTVRDRPFATQLLRGRYRHVHVEGGGLRLGDLTGVALDARLRSVHLPLRHLLRRRVAEIACERVEGRVTLPYGELARVAGVPGLELRPSRDRVLATAVLPLPGIGQLARVTGRAALTHDSGDVWLRVRGLSVAGIQVPSLVLNQLLPALEVPIPLPALPWGLRIEQLDPQPHGLVAIGSADAVVFRPLRPSVGVRPEEWDASPAG
ncbi:LmeA family phospholipid-binding protein [Jatrophihabitans fulvus]